MDEMAVERIPEGEKNKRFKYTRIRLNSWRPELPRFVSFHMVNAHIIQYFKESEWTDKSLVSSHGKRVRSRQDDIDTEVRHMQRKAHLRMLKYGSTPQKCDESKIERGDYVRVKRVATLKRPTDKGELSLYNNAIAEPDGAPSWSHREYRVISADYDNDAFRVDTLAGVFRKQDLCKFRSFRRGDVVRVALTHIPAYRRFMNSKKIGGFKGLRVSHVFTRSLFIVTHLPGDLTEGGRVAPGLFLDVVFPAGHKVGDYPAAFPSLKWETDQRTDEPWDQNPHSAGFYDYQQERIEINPAEIPSKDVFRGFYPSELLLVDAQTQAVFFSGSDDEFKTNYLSIDKTHRWFKEGWHTYPLKGMGRDDPKAPYLKMPLLREMYMEEGTLAYRRCLIRLRDKTSNAVVSRGSTSQKPSVFSKIGLHREECIYHARYFKFLNEYTF